VYGVWCCWLASLAARFSLLLSTELTFIPQNSIQYFQVRLAEASEDKLANKLKVAEEEQVVASLNAEELKEKFDKADRSARIMVYKDSEGEKKKKKKDNKNGDDNDSDNDNDDDKMNDDEDDQEINFDEIDLSHIKPERTKDSRKAYEAKIKLAQTSLEKEVSVVVF
tara:strand:- start:872 stop:1372 length:501 start_codon:yes stop_codon:yes gene_type:complete